MRLLSVLFGGTLIVVLVAGCGDGFAVDEEATIDDGHTYVCNPDSQTRKEAREEIIRRGFRFNLEDFEQAWAEDRELAETYFRAGVVEMVDETYSAYVPEDIFGLAIGFDWGDLMDVSIQCGYPVDRRFGPAELAFRQAVIGGSADVIQVMIDHGIDPNTRREDTGYEGEAYAIHVAVVFDKPRVVRVLLENGADPNARAEDGRTPMDLANITGSEEIAGLLREFGAENG